MYASRHPFRNTLVLEIDADEILSVHGEIVNGSLATQLLDILEAFHAGTDMTRFARENEPNEMDSITETLNHPYRNHGEEIDATLREHGKGQ